MKNIYVIIILSLVLFSCQREEMDENTQNEIEIIDSNINVEGSVIGLVTDEDGKPVVDALVRMENETLITDQFGNFIFIDKQLFADGTYISVEKNGYFHASRRFNAIANEQNNVKIQLIKKVETGSFPSDAGQDINVSTAKILFPGGDYKNLDGSSYLGEVHVFAKYLDPTNPATFEEMPGDLIGLDSEGSLNALATFGMLAVELENDNGEKIYLPEGKQATIKINVPEELRSVAPSVIPLWHFDEVNGIWLEEGEANLVNGVYEGEVSHFSFWNCDYPLPIVDINGTVSINGRLASGMLVKVTDQTTGFTGCATTSSGGQFGGGVPEGVELSIQVLDPCGGILYDETVGPFFEDATLSAINITTILNDVLISGIVTNCTGEAIVDAAVVIDYGVSKFTFLCEDDGSFELVSPSCLGGEVDIYGLDITNSLISPVAQVDITQTQNVGTLIACEDFVEEGWFIEYENMDWGMNEDSTLIGYSVNIDTFFNGAVTNIVLEYTIIDWLIFDPNLDNPQYEGVYTFTIGEDTANVIGQFKSQGFEISGVASYEEINQAGNKYVRLNFTATEVEILDPDIYPGDVGEVRIFLTIPII